MKTLLVILLILNCSELVQATSPKATESIYFNYISNDGSVYLDCRHSPLSSEPERYRIVCGKGTSIIKTFDARFRVRQLNSSLKPVFEIAFWVTDRNQPAPYDHGTTAWISLSKGVVSEVALHQEVENSYAALVIHYSAGL